MGTRRSNKSRVAKKHTHAKAKKAAKIKAAEEKAAAEKKAAEEAAASSTPNETIEVIVEETVTATAQNETTHTNTTEEDSTMTVQHLTVEAAIARALDSKVAAVPQSLFAELELVKELTAAAGRANDALNFYGVTLQGYYYVIDAGIHKPSKVFDDEVAFIELKIKHLKGLVEASVFADIEKAIHDKATNKSETKSTEKATMTKKNDKPLLSENVKAGLYGALAAAATSAIIDTVFEDKSLSSISVDAGLCALTGGINGALVNHLIDFNEPAAWKTAATGITAGAIAAAGVKTASKYLFADRELPSLISNDIPVPSLLD